jgi:UDP-N-acetylglucosamine 3-dehydrogenase
MTLRVGVVGAGNIFERGYLPALRETDAIRVEAIFDAEPARAAAAALARGGPTAAARVVDSLDALLGDPAIEAVFVLTPTDTHADLAIAALEAGRHVLCEKPMARSAADARRMVEAAERTGRRLMIGHTRRFDPRWTAIADQLAAGRVGEPVYVFRSEHAYNGALPGAWQWDDARSGGVLWDVGVHVTELFHWFLGERPRTAFTKVLHSRPESRAGGAPDAAVVTFDFGPARHAVLSVSWIHPPAWGPFYATTEVVGTRGRIEAFDRDSHPAVVVGEGLDLPRYSPLLSARSDAFRREIEHVAAAIETGAPFAVDARDALVAVEMIEAAERSARTGRPERVAP